MPQHDAERLGQAGLFDEQGLDFTVADQRLGDPEHPWGGGRAPVGTDTSEWPTVNHAGRGVNTAHAQAAEVSTAGGEYLTQPPESQTPASAAVRNAVEY